MLIFCNVRHFSLTKRGHGISSGIEERACGNSRRQLKKKSNFHVSWFFNLKFPSGDTQFRRISSNESLLAPEFRR